MSDLTDKTDRTRRALRALRSDTCICKRGKLPGKSHCPRCYHSLPHAMQKALYRKMREGYEQALEESIAFLIAEGAIPREAAL